MALFNYATKELSAKIVYYGPVLSGKTTTYGYTGNRLDTITDQLFPLAQDHVVTVQCTPSVATLWLIPPLAVPRMMMA